MNGFGKTLPSITVMSPGSQPRSYEQNVLLTDWWLIEVESNSQGRRLGVGGFRCNGRRAIRLFKSAAIVKRQDAMTLEAEDGITIVITNGINMFRSIENGFPREVCSRFLCGFPYCWKDFADKCVVKEYIDNFSRSSTFGVNGNATFPDNLPVAHVRDALMLSNGDSARCLLEKLISNHIPTEQGDNAFENDMSKHKRQEDEINEDSRMANGDLQDDAGPKETQNAINVVKKRKYKDHNLHPKPGENVNVCEKETLCGSSIGEKRGDNVYEKDMGCAEYKAKRKRQEDEINEDNQIPNGDLPDDAAPRDSENATNVEKKIRYKGPVLRSSNQEIENICQKETLRGSSVGKNSSRRTTRSMSRSNKLVTNLGDMK